jgi:hypothetical protein
MTQVNRATIGVAGLVVISWIFFVWLFIAPIFLKEEEAKPYKKYGNSVSIFIQKALKGIPPAGYKDVYEKDATVDIVMSDAVEFKWEKAAIYSSYTYPSAICAALSLDNVSCNEVESDALSRSGKYFVLFTENKRIVYKEIFDDEILSFRKVENNRILTPKDSTISVFRDISIKRNRESRREDTRTNLVWFTIVPLMGLLFGLKFLITSFVLGAILILPSLWIIFEVFRGIDGPFGGGVLFLPIAAAFFFMGVSLWLGAIIKTMLAKHLTNQD